MPELISGHTPDRNVFYSSYLYTYMERDVRELSGSVDVLKFNRFITAVAARCSQLLNYNTEQRARWFGYKADYLDVCRVFTSKDIKDDCSTPLTIGRVCLGGH